MMYYMYCTVGLLTSKFQFGTKYAIRYILSLQLGIVVGGRPSMILEFAK